MHHHGGSQRGFEAQCGEELQQLANGVRVSAGIGKRDDFVVEQSTAFAGLSNADLQRCFGRGCHQTGPQESLEVQHGIIPALTQLPHDLADCQHSAPAWSMLELQHLSVDCRAAAHDVREA